MIWFSLFLERVEGGLGMCLVEGGMVRFDVVEKKSLVVSNCV